MSTLRRSLEFISDWIEQNTPDCDLEKGLSYEAIEKKVKKLPFELPIEVYELYMWRNGGSLDMLPVSNLDSEIDCEVIQRFFSLNQSVEVAKDWNNSWFPLFDTDGVIFWIVGTKEKRRFAPIFCNDEFELPKEPRFQSLTEMMAKIVQQLV